MFGMRSAWILALGTVVSCGGASDVSIDDPNGADGGEGASHPDSSATGGHAGTGASGGGMGNNASGAGGAFPGGRPVGSLPGGATCTLATDCRSLSCSGGVCGSTCTSDGAACSSGDVCCSGSCNAGSCQALNTECKTAGNACGDSGECCSRLCSGGTCALGSSYCIQQGDVCASTTDCCSGICNIATGAALGTCGAPPHGASFCNGGIDGTVCDGCGTCCSRLCAPYAPTGVFICQPANGCHIDGDLCRKDSDCCGAPGTGLPGDGNVTCEIEQGQVIGICRNPRGCNPEGNVCHYKNYACSISSARNDCCGAPGNSGACQLDPLGVPRCHALGTCRAPGESCAFTGDCCNNLPCIPDGQGGLQCLVPPDGGPACSAQGARCTVTADCCRGYLCLTELGSTDGVCGVVNPPPVSDGGTPTGDSGAPNRDAGTPPPPYDGGPLPCAAYGQMCSVDGDCCNGVPCSGGICYIPVR